MPTSYRIVATLEDDREVIGEVSKDLARLAIRYDIGDIFPDTWAIDYCELQDDSVGFWTPTLREALPAKFRKSPIAELTF